MRTRQRPNGRRRAKPQSEPTLSVQGAPQILPSHGPALAGGRLPTICRVGGRLVQNAIGRIETLASAPINPNGLTPTWSAALAKSLSSLPPFLSPPAPAALIQLPPPTSAVNWRGN